MPLLVVVPLLGFLGGGREGRGPPTTLCSGRRDTGSVDGSALLVLLEGDCCSSLEANSCEA